MTATLAEARALADAVRATGLPFGLTYTYSGYPLVREARERIVSGALGAVCKLVVQYPQGWLAGPAAGKQAELRVDPARAGNGGCIGDIGTHAFPLAEFVTGLRITRLLADLGTVVPGRQLDDDVAVLLRFDMARAACCWRRRSRRASSTASGSASCALTHPEDGAAEGALFIRDHIIRVTATP